MEVSGHALMHDAEKPAAKLKQIAAQVKSETAVPPRAGTRPALGARAPKSGANGWRSNRRRV